MNNETNPPEMGSDTHAECWEVLPTPPRRFPLTTPLTEDQFNEMPPGGRVELVARALCHFNPDRFYCRNGRLVEVDPLTGRVLLVSATRAWALAAPCLPLFAVGRQKTIPRDYGPLLVAHAARCFPPLKGVRSFPFVTPEKTVARRPGYYKDTGILLRYPERDVVPAPVSEGAARELLQSHLKDFSYEDGWSTLSVLVILAEVVVAVAIGAPAPLHMIRAHDVRAGKTTLGAMLVALFLGCRPSFHGLPRNEVELPYSVAATLDATPAPVLLLDNLPDGWVLADPLLERLFSASGPVPMRRAKSAGNIEPDPTMTTFIATANRIGFSGGMRRRVSVVQLQQQPPDKRFPYPDIVGQVLKARMDLIGAVLTGFLRWRAAGFPEPQNLYPSFVLWSRWAGGLTASLAELYFDHSAGRPGVGLYWVDEWLGQLGTESSPEDESWASVLGAWDRNARTGAWKPLSAKQVLELAETVEAEHLLDQAGNSVLEKSRQIRLGIHLAKLAKSGRVVAGVRVVCTEHGNNRSYTPEEVK